MNVISISVSEPGRALAKSLPYRHVFGSPKETLEEHWDHVEGFVVVLALGAVVRLVAPLLNSKATDPAVVCVDDAGNYAIAVCGGHAAHGNDLARDVASFLGAEPIITTATDTFELAGLDQLPGLEPVGDIAKVTSRLLAGGRLKIDNELGWHLPDSITRLGVTDRSEPAARIVVTDRRDALDVGASDSVMTDSVTTDSAEPPGDDLPRDDLPRADLPGDDLPTVLLHPRSLIVGVGTSSDASEQDVIDAVEAVMRDHAFAPQSLDSIATIDKRAEHPALLELATHLDRPIASFSPDSLSSVSVANPSDVVNSAVNTPSVAEAAALSVAPNATLIVEKTRFEKVTVAIARKNRNRGLVQLVGLGPGTALQRTPEVQRAIRHAQVVIGYVGYVDQCKDLLSSAQEVERYELGEELDRVRSAIEHARQGRRVVVVCSGDPGVYAMASPLLEMLASDEVPNAQGSPRGFDVEVLPGITASLAAASLLGAPLGHDHAIISLSDLLTPWEEIETRVRCAAEADFVIVFYNPRSKRRTSQIEKVKDILLGYRDSTTPVGVVSDAKRSSQSVVVTSLGDLECDGVTMTTLVVVGSSNTYVHDGYMVTPRGYRSSP